MAVQGLGVLVVGGASGIGLATVKLLLREGANVAMCDISSEGETIAKELKAEFGKQRIFFVHGDVRDDAQMEAAFTATKSKFERLDIVVQCAGILNDVDWNRAVDVNLKGIIRGTLLAWKHMGKHEGGNGGAVVNIASIAAFIPLHVSPIYAATKSGIVSLTRCFGEPYHLDHTGVRTYAICPGQTDTAIFENIQLMYPEMSQEFTRMRPTFPMQSAENVARAVLHVLQNGASGTIWVSEDEQPAYQLTFPDYKDMRAAE